TVPRVPFSALMRPGAANDPQVRALAGKVVILATDDGGDRHMTPYARRFFGLAPRLMNGAEIHANAVEMLLSGERLLPAADATRWALGAVLCAALGLALLAGGWLWPAAGLVAGIAVAALASRFAFGHLQLLPVAALQTTLVALAIGLALYRALYENRRRERMQGLFGRYVSDQVVRELVRTGSEPALGGELRTVTVLFCDIQKFSTMSEALTPQQVVTLLNTYLGAAADAVDAEGGTLDKFTGDGLMAVFGAPAVYPDHAARAVRAAQAMDRAAREVAKTLDPMLTGLGLTPFRVGLGLHTGQAVLGSIGSQKRSEYTAIGDAVNVAARVEGLSRELGATIVLTRETWEAAGLLVKLGSWHTMQVKGRRAAVQVAAVLDEQQDDR
ncbi:MAG: adenylate/guanylate cyclase with Chase sensor, partial [Rhodoferax sp.]|nr:adenylate/guanylate cyclase with Chase sensor [Rhodoferax sp.]